MRVISFIYFKCGSLNKTVGAFFCPSSSYITI
nr:MAG TPA: hypothetical protein [Caudoviricetes sp.]